MIGIASIIALNCGLPTELLTVDYRLRTTRRSSLYRCYRSVTDIVVDPLPAMSLLPLLPRVASVYVSVPVIAPPSNRPENASVLVTVTEPTPERTGPVADL